MDKKNLMPQAAQPVNRTTLGQLPPELAELSEEALQLHRADDASVLPAHGQYHRQYHRTVSPRATPVFI